MFTEFISILAISTSIMFCAPAFQTGQNMEASDKSLTVKQLKMGNSRGNKQTKQSCNHNKVARRNSLFNIEIYVSKNGPGREEGDKKLCSKKGTTITKTCIQREASCYIRSDAEYVVDVRLVYN